MKSQQNVSTQGSAVLDGPRTSKSMTDGSVVSSMRGDEKHDFDQTLPEEPTSNFGSDVVSYKGRIDQIEAISQSMKTVELVVK